MIKDNIRNAKDYYNLSERIEKGLKYLENTDFSKVDDGTYEILGKEVFAIVQNYLSKEPDSSEFESHKKYTDIQYIIKGEEQIGIGDIEDFSQITQYDEEKDIMFLSAKKGCTPDFIRMQAKEFAIFFPHDAHKPSIAVQSPSFVKKIVVKVLT